MGRRFATCQTCGVTRLGIEFEIGDTCLLCLDVDRTGGGAGGGRGEAGAAEPAFISADSSAAEEPEAAAAEPEPCRKTPAEVAANEPQAAAVEPEPQPAAEEPVAAEDPVATAEPDEPGPLCTICDRLPQTEPDGFCKRCSLYPTMSELAQASHPFPSKVFHPTPNKVKGTIRGGEADPMTLT